MEKEVKKIKKDDMVTVYGTGASLHLGYGVGKKVHKVLADKLIAAGKATSKRGK